MVRHVSRCLCHLVLVVGASTGPSPSHMTDSSTIYVPRSVAELVDDVHQREARSCDPKWKTVERAVRGLADDGGNDE